MRFLKSNDKVFIHKFTTKFFVYINASDVCVKGLA